MKFLKCNQPNRVCVRHNSKEQYCSGKLPCGRCATGYGFGTNPCGSTEYIDFDCDNCIHRFICLTTSFENDYKNSSVYPLNGCIVNWRKK